MWPCCQNELLTRLWVIDLLIGVKGCPGYWNPELYLQMDNFSANKKGENVLDSSVRLLFKICVFRSVCWLSHGAHLAGEKKWNHLSRSTFSWKCYEGWIWKLEEAEVSDPRGISYSRPLEFFDFGTLYTLVLNTTLQYNSKLHQFWFQKLKDMVLHHSRLWDTFGTCTFSPTSILPLVNKRASGPQQAKQGEELEKEKNQRGGLHIYALNPTESMVESRKRAWIWPDMERI